MKIETQTPKNIEKDTQIVMSEEDMKILNQGETMPFSDLIALEANPENNNIISLSDIDTDYNYDLSMMDISDALFFTALAQNAQFTAIVNQNGSFESLINTEINQNTITTKTIEVTNKITELIEKAQNTQKPVRISFGNDVSVVLKIDKHGKITAEFIPGNMEAETYIRNNIPALRQRFDEQNLPYNDIMYKQNSNQNRKNKNKGDK